MSRFTENLQPELTDLLEMISRYVVANKNNVCILYKVVAFKKDPKHKCIDCGEDCDMMNDKASRIGAYGDLYTLREMINDLRDLIEDEVGKEGFVNV